MSADGKNPTPSEPDDAPAEPAERNDTVSEIEDAARQEAEYPADETDEG